MFFIGAGNKARYLKTAEELWQKKHGIPAAADHRCVINLGDDPEFAGPKNPGSLPTFKEHAGCLFMPSRGRLGSGN